MLWLWLRLDDARAMRRAQVPAATTSPRQTWLLAFCGLMFAGDLAVWHWSIKLTTVANATLLANVAPIFVTIGARVLFKERITPAFIVGMMVSLTGAAMLVGASFEVSVTRLLGDLLGVITAMFYGAYLLSVKALRRHHSTARIMMWSGVSTCVVLLIVTLSSGETIAVPSLYGWVILIALALISHGGGQSLIAYGFAHLPASFSSVVLLVQPATAALLAWALFDEAITPLQGAGGVLVLAGILIAGRASHRAANATRQL